MVLWRERPWTVQLAPGALPAVSATLALNVLVILPLKAARWRVALSNPPSFRQVLAATLEGLLANAAIGFGSGDVVRAARLRSQQASTGGDRAVLPGAPSQEVPDDPGRVGGGRLVVDYVSTWAERGAEVLALALLILGTAVATNLAALAWVIAGLAAGAYGTALAAGRLVVPRLGRWPRIQRGFRAWLQASTARRVVAMAVLSLVGWASEIGMLVLFQTVFHLAPSLRMAVLTLVGINAAILIPSIAGNFGTFEAGATMAMVMSGAPRDVAVTYALTYHLIHVVPVVLVASAVAFVRSHSRTGPHRYWA